MGTSIDDEEGRTREYQDIEAQKQTIMDSYFRISKNIFRGSVVGTVLGVLSVGVGFSYVLGVSLPIEQINPKSDISAVIQYNETRQNRRDVENSIEQLTTMRNSLVPELPYHIEDMQPLLEIAFSNTLRDEALDSSINRYEQDRDSIAKRLDGLEGNNLEIKAYRKWKNVLDIGFSWGLVFGGLLLYAFSILGGPSLRRKFEEKRDEKISKLETQASS